jgi:hypothetical protein
VILMAPATRTATRAALLALAVVALTSCSNDPQGSITAIDPSAGASTSSSSPPAAETSQAPSASAPAPAAPAPDASSPKKTVTSDVSVLSQLGVIFNKRVVLDLADDGEDRYLNVRADGVNFTGTTMSNSSMMSLVPAPVRRRTEENANQVLLKPPFYRSETGPDSCITDTAAGVLAMLECKAGAAEQVWQLFPAGDSGLFEMRGVHTQIRVNNGRITTNGDGSAALQTLPYE